MKSILRRDIVPLSRPPSLAGQATASLALVLGLSLFLGGCKKAAEPVTSSVPDASQTAGTEPNRSTAQPPAGAPAAPAVQDAQPDLPELNRSLLRWMMGNRRAPKNFEDFAATAGVPIPPPPAGKKYVIAKDMHIVLVNK